MSVSTAPAAVDVATVSVSYRCLIDALKAAGLLAGGTRPTFRHIEVAAADGRLTLTAADPTTAVTATVAAAIDGAPQRAMVQWAELSKLLPAAVKGTAKRQLDQLDLTLEISDQSLTVGVAGYQLPVTVAPDATLPTIPDTTPGTHVVNRDEFAAMFARVVVAASNDQQYLPLFSKVETVLGHDTLTMTATDRYRVARGTVAANGTSDQSVLLPAALVTKLLPFCTDHIFLGTDTVDNDEWITFHSGPITAKIRSTSETFPRLGHIIDQPNPDIAAVDRDQLRIAADRANAITGVLANRGTAAQIVIDTDQLSIIPGTRDGHTATAPTIPANTTTDQTWTGGINPTYLADAIAHITGDTVALEYTRPGKPIKLTGDDTYEHVIMLMRLPN